MIRLLAGAKNFNQLFLENALIKKMFKIGTTQDNYSGARGAPWVSKFGNPLIRKIFGSDVSVRPSVRPSIQTLGEREGSPNATRPGEAECPFFSCS